MDLLVRLPSVINPEFLQYPWWSSNHCCIWMYTVTSPSGLRDFILKVHFKTTGDNVYTFETSTGRGDFHLKHTNLYTATTINWDLRYCEVWDWQVGPRIRRWEQH